MIARGRHARIVPRLRTARRNALWYQRVLARMEDARAILRDGPGRSGQLEAEVAAAEARTTVLVRQLPGTAEEILQRAVLEGSTPPAPSGHDASQ